MRGWEWRHLRSRLDLSTSVIPLPARAGALLLPTSDHLRVGIVTGAALRLTDLDGGKPVQVPLPARGLVIAGATQTRLGLRVAVWVDNRTFYLVDENGRSLTRVDEPLGNSPRWVIVSPDGSRLASENLSNGWHGVIVLDAASGKQTASCKGPDSEFWSWAFSPDGKLFSAGFEDGTAVIWDAATGSLHAARHLSRAREQGPGRLVQPGRHAPGVDLLRRDGAPVGRRDGPGGRAALRPPRRRRHRSRVQSGRAMGRLRGQRPHRPRVAGRRVGRT